MIPLSYIREGMNVEISSVAANGLSKRLADMGFIGGRELNIRKKDKHGMIVKLGGCVYAMGKGIVKYISVREGL